MTRNKLFLVLTLALSIFFVLTGAASAQKRGTNTRKHKKIAAKPNHGVTKKAGEEVELNSDPDRRSRKIQGGGDNKRTPQFNKGDVKSSRKATGEEPREVVNNRPTESKLVRAASFNDDLRSLPYRKPIFKESPEHEAPDADEIIEGDPVSNFSAVPTTPSAVAPAPLANFVGLDLATFGAGRPPDTNGDVGPTYFIQSVNSSIGIYRKSDGVRVVGVTLNTFMSQGHFGNLCDTNNFGDPVVLYDSFEDRWIITDFAFIVDGSGNVTSNSFQCFAASKTGDPVSGGWNYYSTVDTDFLGDYPKFGVWNDGIYMTANMFGKAAGGSFATVRARALNKAQMYAGLPTVQVVSFDVGGGEFTILPANARLQTGTPPAGSPNYMSVVGLFTNAISVYKFKVDWNKISTSTVTGPSITIAPASWSSAPSTVPAQGGSNRDTLATRLMVQNQYTNIGGVESLWNSHTVRGSVAAQSAVRYYQVNVTGGNVAATTTQAATHNPDTVNRYIPSLGVDKDGDMMLGYSASSSTLFPAIRYAGRLAADPANTITQTENSLIEGTGTEVAGTSTRWGDYSTMTLDPNGCTFWQTHEYYATTGNNWQTRIGSIAFPSCIALQNNGVLQGTVTSAATGLPISGAIVNFGSRTTTTNTNGVYTFANLPQGTYLAETASATGYNTAAAASNLVVTDGTTTTQNFSLTVSSTTGCLTDTTQSDLQTGVPSNVDLTASAGDALLAAPLTLDQQNTTLSTSGNGITTTGWSGQTFVPAVSGPLVRADINLFCSGCTGTAPTVTVSLRATSAGLPTGPDLASTTITTSTSGSGGFFTFNFASPVTVTAGTTYALTVRNATNPSVGTNAVLRSATSTYANGARVTSADSGVTWTAQTTDLGFKTYINTGFQLTGNLTSSTKDSSPQADNASIWTTLSWTASTPANTAIVFQAAGSNNPNGPFNFVGPDGTAGTFYTTSGASISQFNGLRYLKYKAYLSTTNSAVTPTLSDVTVCFTNPSPDVWSGSVSSDWNNPANWSGNRVPTATDKAIIPASGVVNNPVNTTDNTVGTLQLDSGVIDTGANTLTVSTCSPSAVTGGSAASYVKGNLVRCIDNQGSYNFPVGTSAGFTPVSLGNIIGTGTFKVTSLDGLLTGTSNTMSLQRNWGLTPSAGITQTDLTLNYLDADVPAGANESAFQFVRRSGITDTSFAPSSINPAGNTATLNAVTSFSNWTLGVVVAPTAAGASIAGRVLTASGRPIANAVVSIQSNNGTGVKSARTNSFGNYQLNDIASGQNYTMSVSAKGYTFQPKLVSLTGNLTSFDFSAQ